MIPTIVEAPFFFIDTHCHLDMDAYADDLGEVLKSADAHRIKSIITIGIDEKSSFAAVTLAEKHPMIKACIGVHPHDAASVTVDTYDTLRNLASEKKEFIVGYGEIGLDYAKDYSDPAVQRLIFREQLELAKELHLPIVVHDRDAHDDTLEILKAIGPFPDGGVMHCFSGNGLLAGKIIDLGLHISIPGVVTFKNSGDLKNVASDIPLNSLLLETDGPFLAPVPWRGKRNTPTNILYTAMQVAALRNISLEQLAEQTSRNAQQVFRYTVEQ